MAKSATLGMQRFRYLLITMRKRQGWSQRVAGKRLGLSQARVQVIEAGGDGTVGFDVVERAVKLFGLDPRYFFAPGRIELDPSDYEVSVRSALEDRMAALESRLEVKEGSGPRAVVEPTPIRGRKRT